MTNKIISLPTSVKIKEQLADIEWCRSTFLKYSNTMEENYTNDDVTYAYQFCNSIRIEAKGVSEQVYFEALKVLGLYGDLLYGNDVRLTFWKKRITEHDFDQLLNVANREIK